MPAQALSILKFIICHKDKQLSISYSDDSEGYFGTDEIDDIEIVLLA